MQNDAVSLQKKTITAVDPVVSALVVEIWAARITEIQVKTLFNWKQKKMLADNGGNKRRRRKC